MRVVPFAAHLRGREEKRASTAHAAQPAGEQTTQGTAHRPVDGSKQRDTESSRKRSSDAADLRDRNVTVRDKVHRSVATASAAAPGDSAAVAHASGATAAAVATAAAAVAAAATAAAPTSGAATVSALDVTAERRATLRPRRLSGHTAPPAQRHGEPEEKNRETGNKEAKEEEEEVDEAEEEDEEKAKEEEVDEAEEEEAEEEEAGDPEEKDGEDMAVVGNIDKDGLPMPLVDLCKEFDVATLCADIMEKSDTRGAVVAVHNLAGYRFMKDKDVQHYVDMARANGDANSNLNCLDPVMDYLIHKRLIAQKAVNLKKLKRKRQPMAHRNPLKYILDKFPPQRRLKWEKKMYIFVGCHRATLVDMPIAIRHGLLYNPFELRPYALTRRNIRRVLVDVKAVYILRFKALPRKCR